MGAMGGNTKGAAMDGGKAAVGDWQKTGVAGAVAPPAAGAAGGTGAAAGGAPAAPAGAAHGEGVPED
jgi:hypothetical protein